MKNNIYPWLEPYWQQLLAQHRQQRLAHALLLQGPAGVGKPVLAQALGAALLCTRPDAEGRACGRCDACRWLQAGNHPDFSHIQPEPPPTSTSKTPVLSIRIDRIRELCRQLATTSRQQGYRIALIENADAMASAAANSLLKTLEEPGTETLIILTTSRPYRLPVTIRSRCQCLRIPPPATEQALDWLAQQPSSDHQTALLLAHGAPLLAADYAEAGLEQRQQLCSALQNVLEGKSALGHAEALAEIPRQRALGWLQDWITDLIKCQSGASAEHLVNRDQVAVLQRLAQKAPTRGLLDYHSLVCDTVRASGISLNPLLLWENLLISWDRLYP